MKILISGSSSGIGRSISEALLKHNDHIIGLARNHQKFTPAGNYTPYEIDFSKIAILEQKLKSIQKEQPDIDILICSAGYGEFIELEQFSLDKMQTMLNVNFLSQALLIKLFLPALKKKQAGKIIVIGSECALEGQKKGSMYCATKFALRGFTQSLRKECAASNISVTLINPGMVDTPFFDALSFKPGKDNSHSIQSNQLSTLVSMLIKENNNCVYEEINLQPMKKVLEKNKI